MRSQAAINPTRDQVMTRNIGRVSSLRLAIQKANARGQTARVDALNAELSRRLTALSEFRTQLDAVL